MIILFYFSGTGNTWWCAEKLKVELESLDSSVEMYSLENPILEENNFVENKIKESFQIVIGYPTYGSDMPLNVREFVKNLPIVEDQKKIAFFCTQAGYTGDGNVYFMKDVEAKGYNFLQSIQITLTTNFNVNIPPFNFSKPAAGKKLERKKTKALKKIKMLAECIQEGKRKIVGTQFYYWPGKIQRYFFNKGEKSFPKYFIFNKEKCVNCQLCVKNCPTENLFFDETGELNWTKNEKCIACVRCYNFCPKDAIFIGKKLKSDDKWVRFKGPLSKLNISDIKK